MGTWQVTSDLLAKARFDVSRKAEVVAALEALVRPSDPVERAFRAAHHVAFEAMLDERPARRDLIAHSRRPRLGSRPGWLAHFLASPPPAPDSTFAAELADVAAIQDEAMRADLRETMQGPLPRSLETGGVTEEAAFVLEWIWTHAVATDWPRGRRLTLRGAGWSRSRPGATREEFGPPHSRKYRFVAVIAAIVAASRYPEYPTEVFRIPCRGLCNTVRGFIFLDVEKCLEGYTVLPMCGFIAVLPALSC
jgi:hypothetical protein